MVPFAELYLLLLFPLVLWGVVSYRHPAFGYFVVLSGYLTVFHPLKQTVGPISVSVVDLAFAVYLVSFVLWLGLSDTTIAFRFDMQYLSVVLAFSGVIFLAPFVGIVLWGYPMTVLTAGLRYMQWLSFFPLTIVFAREVRSFEPLLLRVLAFSVLIHGFVAVGQAAGYVHVIPGAAIEKFLEFGRPVGYLPGPNQLGSYAAVCLLIALSYFFTARVRERAILVFIIVVSAFLIILSESRAGLGMAFGPALLLLAVVVWKREIAVITETTARYLLVSPVVFVVALVLFHVFVSDITDRLDRFGELFEILKTGDPTGTTLAGRIRIWNKALDTYGRVGWQGSLVPPTHLTEPTHNYYLSLLVQAGPLGVGTLLALFLFSFRHGVRYFLSTRSPAFFTLTFVTILLAAGSLVRHPLVDPPVQILFWALVGLAASAQRPAHGTEIGTETV